MRCEKCGSSEIFNRKHTLCHSCYGKRYRNSEHGKAARERYLRSEKGKLASDRYMKSEKGKEALKRYHQSDKGKEAKREYMNRKLDPEHYAKTIISQVEYIEKILTDREEYDY